MTSAPGIGLPWSFFKLPLIILPFCWLESWFKSSIDSNSVIVLVFCWISDSLIITTLFSLITFGFELLGSSERLFSEEVSVWSEIIITSGDVFKSDFESITLFSLSSPFFFVSFFPVTFCLLAKTLLITSSTPLIDLFEFVFIWVLLTIFPALRFFWLNSVFKIQASLYLPFFKLSLDLFARIMLL